jgi:hypothetical protein
MFMSFVSHTEIFGVFDCPPPPPVPQPALMRLRSAPDLKHLHCRRASTSLILSLHPLPKHSQFHPHLHPSQHSLAAWSMGHDAIASTLSCPTNNHHNASSSTWSHGTHANTNGTNTNGTQHTRLLQHLQHHQQFQYGITDSHAPHRLHAGARLLQGGATVHGDTSGNSTALYPGNMVSTSNI